MARPQQGFIPFLPTIAVAPPQPHTDRMGIGRHGDTGIGGQVRGPLPPGHGQQPPGPPHHHPQAQHRQAAGQPHHPVLQPGGGGSQPAQGSLPIAHHGIHGAHRLEAPAHGHRTRRPFPPQGLERHPHPHPEQGGKGPVNGIFAGAFRHAPQDLTAAQIRHVAPHDPGQGLTGCG